MRAYWLGCMRPAQFDQPSQAFLKFAAQFLSNRKSDTFNNPVFKSCLLRIPGSYN
jgi:hypothetical protein